MAINDSVRPETGPLEFQGDWPGTFIRGDNAGHYALELGILLDWLDALPPDRAYQDVVGLYAVRGLLDDLSGSRVTEGGDPPGVQRLRPWVECLPAAETAPDGVPPASR